MVTCQVDSTSSRNASNSSSARSISSTSSTDRRLAQRPQHGTGQQEPLVEQLVLDLRQVLAVGGHRLDGAQVEDLAGEVPVVEGLGRVDALVALQPDQRQVERRRDAPRPARSCRCRAPPRAAAVAAAGARARQPWRGRRRRGIPCRQAPASVPPRTQTPRVAPCPQHHPSERPIEGATVERTVRAPSEVVGGVDIAPGGEVAALHELVLVGRQVVAGAPVAGSALEHPRPVVAHRSRRGARGPLGMPPAPGPRGPHRRARQHPLHDRRAHVGEVDEQDARDVGVASTAAPADPRAARRSARAPSPPPRRPSRPRPRGRAAPARSASAPTTTTTGGAAAVAQDADAPGSTNDSAGGRRPAPWVGPSDDRPRRRGGDRRRSPGHPPTRPALQRGQRVGGPGVSPAGVGVDAACPRRTGSPRTVATATVSSQRGGCSPMPRDGEGRRRVRPGPPVGPAPRHPGPRSRWPPGSCACAVRWRLESSSSISARFRSCSLTATSQWSRGASSTVPYPGTPATCAASAASFQPGLDGRDDPRAQLLGPR